MARSFSGICRREFFIMKFRWIIGTWLLFLSVNWNAQEEPTSTQTAADLDFLRSIPSETLTILQNSTPEQVTAMLDGRLHWSHVITKFSLATLYGFGAILPFFLLLLNRNIRSFFTNSTGRKIATQYEQQLSEGKFSLDLPRAILIGSNTIRVLAGAIVLYALIHLAATLAGLGTLSG